MPLFNLPMEILLSITDYLDDSGMSALARTNKGVHSLLNELLYRRDITHSNRFRSRSLTWAAEKGVVGTIQRAVHASRHFNPVPESFHITLQVATDHEHVPIVELLLKVKGINPNFYGGGGYVYPLCIAAENGNSAIVELLLANVNIDPDVKRHPYNISPLLCACLGEHVSIVRQLLARDNVDVNCRSILFTPLTAACRMTHPLLEIPKFLLEREDIDINLPDKEGRTALFWACHNNCLELVDLLLEKDNIDPNVGDKSGRTPLVEACRVSRSPAIVCSLLSHRDIDPNALDNALVHWFRNPFIHDAPEIKALLIAAGANEVEAGRLL
jgi:ankyrin repeat protein